jgi:hypothetical protein
MCSHAPSKALQDSHKSQAEEAAAKATHEPWARGNGKPAKKPRAVAALNISTVLTALVPKNYQQAILSPEIWMPPMQKDYTALVGHETWILVNTPLGANIVDCKWVYMVKYNTEGEVIKWKACLVTKGFQQIEGVNFFEMYVGVVLLRVSEDVVGDCGGGARVDDVGDGRGERLPQQ